MIGKTEGLRSLYTGISQGIYQKRDKLIWWPLPAEVEDSASLCCGILFSPDTGMESKSHKIGAAVEVPTLAVRSMLSDFWKGRYDPG
ncbi:MAG: hypothetical protein D6704_06170 [Nitrospirae bacterium]|nr:MAG: hypothetical protein D6704_06170 [Nitrospirota bacterium]